ncbi:hypothetical protein HPC49_02575 [Pyxidicoccus fallax]|uniref:Glycosyl hydrolase n=1 Tax=Pyxidicoccus fallax TaxID=394095 RepID=A0A848L5Y1_9BACT|nr:hypothetical protein [Pyxidicoccus fallax]NMO14350.1 hypothetical protein [Pyxidicoccus fallax]NPC77139.1 hypothetical protein [Pyxidicoccus fallax]
MLKRHRRLIATSTVVVVAVVAVPSGASAYKRWKARNARTKISHFLKDPSAGEVSPEVLQELMATRGEAEPEQGEAEGDDAMRRRVASRMLWGVPTPEVMEHRARVAYRESRRWEKTLPRARAPWDWFAEPSGANKAVVSGLSWVNLGPTNANFQFNGTLYNEVDSGRISGIAVHPVDPQVVYLATSGGGVWKTFNFGTANPTWAPVSESLGNLAIGAMDLDPTNPETLYVGAGDFVDTPGGHVVKSEDGGATWGEPVGLSGQYPAGSGGLSVKALRIRAVKVDPANPSVVLVGTEVGLFRSTNAGASFTLVDLPNSGTVQKSESVWSIVYTGAVGGVSRWALSGTYACAANLPPPEPGLGQEAGEVGCAAGNPGDIWTSTDAGATWSSRKAAGTIPSTLVGRITLAAGTPSSATPPVTVVYAQLGNQDEYYGSAGAGYWRSINSGTNWTSITGTLANATTSVNGERDCGSVNVNDAQAWYNAAIAVDPANDNNVLVGGMLCGLRTRNGLASSPSWENVSHWLPSSGYGQVTGGTLDYVHADWHRALIVRTATGSVALAGTDGGLYVSRNLFDATPAYRVAWDGQNRGIVTHLSYSVASGDPATGNPYLAYTGLQDNGTRFRDPSAGPLSTTFNQVIGGDGFGAVAAKNPVSGATIYWASVNGSSEYCIPTAANNQCNAGTAWTTRDPTPRSISSCSTDGYQFIIRYALAPASPNPNTVLTATNSSIHRVSGTGNWQVISPCLTGYTRLLSASPTIDGLYAVSMSGGRFYVTSNCQGSTTNCTWTRTSVLGFDVNGNGTIALDEQLSYTTQAAFPPTTPQGTSPGDVFVAASVAPLTGDNATVVPDALGHLFITRDRGTTWAPLHGNGTGHDLPNVGIDVVQYDPSDLTNRTLYVGTELGVYRSTDAGETWERFGSGLPLARVSDMFISRTGALMRVATYGRGLWELYPSATAEKGVSGNGDWNRDQQLDFVDLAAAASRLGSDPSTTALPHYDWNSDMTGTVNGIDSADLSELLNRMGGRP